jgi:hypothetical protein
MQGQIVLLHIDILRVKLQQQRYEYFRIICSSGRFESVAITGVLEHTKVPRVPIVKLRMKVILVQMEEHL